MTLDDIALAVVRARHADGPDHVLADLLSAADGAAAQDDITRSHVLATAADVLARAGRNAEALEMSRRALAAADGPSDRAFARVTLGSRLVGVGRFEDADAVFREAFADQTARQALPPALAAAQAGRDFAAAGEHDRALRWVDLALSQPGSQAPLALLEQRRGVRAALGLDPDEDDVRAVRLRGEHDGKLMSARLRAAGRPWTLFWSEFEYGRLARQLPGLAGRVAPSWQQHRLQVELTLRGQDRGGAPAVLCPASVEWLPAYLDDAEQGPAPDGALDGFATYLLDLGVHIEWAPGLARRCWCESGRRYQKCCARL